MDRRYATKKLWAALLLAGLLITPARAETVTYLHTDLLGSVVLETDQNRNVVKRYEYEPYGLPRQAVADQPGYTGHVHDAGAGLVYMQQRYYDPEVGRFLSIDPVGVDLATGANFNRYWYANNNPYRFTDLDGRLPLETIWDVANIGIGVASAYSNFSQGNIGAGFVDVGGVLVDTAATALPYVPGGAGTAIKASRTAGAAVDASRGASSATDAAKGADFVVTPNGTAVPTSQSRMTEGFESAGMQGTPLPGGKGTSYTTPDGTTVRAMEPSGQAPRRASFNNANGGPVTPDGTVPQPPRGATPAERREYVRDRTHVEQTK